MRAVLIELFDREFVESQEAVGANVVGQFTDVERPDRFVWLRSFADMEARRDALAAFYGGPVWGRHQDVANATMIDFDDVRLLRPVDEATAFGPAAGRPVPGHTGPPVDCRFTVTAFPVAEHDVDAVVELVEQRLGPMLDAAGGRRVAVLRTEPAVNTFPAPPRPRGRVRRA